MKIAFVSDFFLVDGVIGGAELVNDCLIKHLQDRDYTVEVYRSNEFKDTSRHDFFIISNFVNLSEEVKEALLEKSYMIYEHDHKYLKNRNPSVFPDFKAPSHMIINEKFYRCAKAVFCQSELHAEVVKKNLSIRNVINAGCSL